MSHFIDRRLNPKDKSLSNRQRFLRRARDELRHVFNKKLKSTPIADVDADHAVTVSSSTTGEPSFRQATATGRRTVVLPGNTAYSAGDRIPKHGQAGGQLGRQAGGSAPDDNFHFILNREEVLDLFFEDLELPDMVKLHLNEVPAFKFRRSGYTATGPPANINVARTMHNSLGRRIALKRPPKGAMEEVAQQISELENYEQTPVIRIRLLKLQETLRRLTQRRKLVAYVDPLDIRYNRFEARPVPNTAAVMFCLMDVSGSMGEREKDLAKRFFVLLHLFLKRRYERTDIVFIRHTHEAKVVDEETFFYSTQSGGTIVSSALDEMQRVIAEKYPVTEWNIYAAQASDGDNSPYDSNRCQEVLEGGLLAKCQYFAYVEIIDARERDIFHSATNGTPLWKAYRAVSEKDSRLQMARMAVPEDIYPVFRHLFAKHGYAGSD
ncbi:YeaH/YhbH family protein [Mesorhizobium sp. KR1-2]|uniref:YeaH/YhbH family protein n=1 Tax=Mesorhizobium sp. KR1-2 TaxID=3156609 RepID=UPI0032B472CD